MFKKNRGSTLIELVIYSALLVICLMVLYTYFIQISSQKIYQIADNSLYTNSARILSDLQTTIKNATEVDTPTVGLSADSLSLNNGAIIYSLDSSGRLQKSTASSTSFVSDQDVRLENLNFTTLGPATDFVTVKIIFTLKSNYQVAGRERQESFQTAVTLR